jgi:preprotein translocase subunit SecG
VCQNGSSKNEVLQNPVIIFVTTIHVIVCLLLIIIILLQQGKSADLAAAFGGQGSQTAFGPRSAANLLTKSTAWLAGIFILTSISLTVLMQHQTTHRHSVLSGSSTSQSTPKSK